MCVCSSSVRKNESSQPDHSHRTVRHFVEVVTKKRRTKHSLLQRSHIKRLDANHSGLSSLLSSRCRCILFEVVIVFLDFSILNR